MRVQVLDFWRELRRTNIQYFDYISGDFMKIYIGNAGKLEYLDLIRQNGYGVCLIANQWRYPKPDISWFLDNGAFHAYNQGKPFDSDKFVGTLEKLELCNSSPDFIVVPDIVAGGLKSLEFSREWIHSIPAGHPVYLAVQDGMIFDDILHDLDLYDGVFVGGTLDWKLSTMEEWATIAHDCGLKCHVGRIGTYRRLIMADNAGVDSVDSSNFAQQNRTGVFGQNSGFKKIEAFEKQTTLLGSRAVDLFGDAVD